MVLITALDLMEGEDDRHVTSPVELEYPTWLSEGKVLCQTLPSVPGSDVDGHLDALGTEGGVYIQVVTLGQPYLG